MARLLSKEREGERAPGGGHEAPGTNVSVVTKDMRVIGDIETAGAIRIEGAVTGSVKARSLELCASGSVEGDLHAIEGEQGEQPFVIGGSVRGGVHASHVEVRQGGSVLGGVVAEQATVRGRVQGGILARSRLALTETSVVEGDVHARRLALEEGGQVNGNIRIGDQAATGARGPAHPRGPAQPAPEEGRGLAAVGADPAPAQPKRAS